MSLTSGIELEKRGDKSKKKLIKNTEITNAIE